MFGLNKEFINGLRASLESHMDEEFIPEKYAGSEVAEELLAMDDVENMCVASESYAQALCDMGVTLQEVALESAGLSIEEFSKFTQELGTEAIMNTIKRGGYDVIIAIKKVCKKLIALVMAVVDFFILADGRWKSYSKLFKKYREKLSRLKPDTKPREDEKLYKIRKEYKPLEEKIAAVKAAVGVIGQSKALVTSADFLTKLVDFVKNMAAVTLKVNFKNMQSTSAINDYLEEIVKAYQSKDGKAEAKEIAAAAKEAWNETEEVNADKAKTTLINVLLKLEKETAKDLKFVKDIKKIKKEIDKAIEKFDNNKYDQDTLRLLGTMSVIVNDVKYFVNASVKEANSMMQAVLADAAKVIAGETRISD